MSKEYMQALDDLFGLVAFLPRGSFERAQKYFDILEPALQRLEAIDNSKSDKALRCLDCLQNTIDKYLIGPLNDYVNLFDYITSIKNYILKAQEQEKEIDRLENKCLDVLGDNIRLEKVLRIIKEKPDIVMTVKRYSTYDNFKANNMTSDITQDEFNFLKEMTNNVKNQG